MMDNDEIAKLVKNLEPIVRQARKETLKRWGQEKCERCEGLLETVFDDEGRNPIRICWSCEVKDARMEDTREA
jgi:hypothetical protein